MVFPFEQLPNELKSKVVRQVYLEARQRPQEWHRGHPVSRLSRVSKQLRQICAKYRFETISYPGHRTLKDPPPLVCESATSLDFDSTRTCPDLSLYPRFDKIIFSAKDANHFWDVICWMDQLNCLADDPEWDMEEEVFTPEGRAMGQILYDHEKRVRRVDLGAMDLDSAVQFLEHFGENLFEFSYGIDSWPEDLTVATPVDEDRPTDVRLVPLLSLPVVRHGDPGILPHFAYRSLVSLGNLRSLTLGSRSPPHLTELGPSIHPSWMTLPYQFSNTLTSLTLRLEYLDRSAFEFAALFSNSLTSLTLSAHETNLRGDKPGTKRDRHSFPFVQHLQLEGYEDDDFPTAVLQELSPSSLPKMQVLRWKLGPREAAEERDDVFEISGYSLNSFVGCLNAYSISVGESQLRQVDLEITEEETVSKYELEKFEILEFSGISTSYSWVSPRSDRMAEPDYPDYPEEFPDLDEDSFDWNGDEGVGFDEDVDSDGGYREDQYDNLPNYW